MTPSRFDSTQGVTFDGEDLGTCSPHTGVSRRHLFQSNLPKLQLNHHNHHDHASRVIMPSHHTIHPTPHVLEFIGVREKPASQKSVRNTTNQAHHLPVSLFSQLIVVVLLDFEFRSVFWTCTFELKQTTVYGESYSRVVSCHIHKPCHDPI